MKTFGRRGGRPLSARQQDLVRNTLPGLHVPIGEAGALNPHDLYSSTSEIWLEIGFGGGEHVSGQATQNPHVGILASEVFFEGVAKLLGQIDDQNLSNIRLWPDDARLLVKALAPDTIDRAFILFPDPWPKARHQKRRLIQADVLDALARVLKPGAELRFATDVRSYADAALLEFLAHPAFSWTAQTADDWRNVPADHIPTRYQAKRLGDIEPVFFEFLRQS